MEDKQYIHKPVVFNMRNPYHRKVFEWMAAETSNYSGFIFQTIAMRYEGFTRSQPKLESEVEVDEWL